MLAQMLWGFPTKSPAQVVYRAYAVNATTLNANTAQTFSAVSIGTADPKRYVLVAVCYRNVGTAAAYPAITVGGVSTTVVAAETIDGNAYSYIVITNSPVSSGTTADIVLINNSLSSSRRQLFVYSVIPSGATVQVLGSNSQASTATPSGSLSWNFSSVMSSFAKGVHLSTFPNTGTIDTATGGMTYDIASQTAGTGIARPGTIGSSGIYTTPYSSTTFGFNGVAVVLE